MRVGDKVRVTGVRMDGEEFGVTGIIVHIFKAEIEPVVSDILMYYRITPEDIIFNFVCKVTLFDRIVLMRDGYASSYLVMPKLVNQVWRKVYDKKIANIVEDR